MKKTNAIALNAAERALLGSKARMIEQGEQARADLSAIAACIVERAGQPAGEYQISADFSALKRTPAGPATP